MKRNVNEKVDFFKKTVKNILSTFTLHETITCDDRNPPRRAPRIFGGQGSKLQKRGKPIKTSRKRI